MAPAHDQYDTPWKSVLTRYFPDFMAFYFPDAHAAIDWTRRYRFLDQELAQLRREASVGKRILDKLVQVRRLDGAPRWVYVHIELQGAHDVHLAERVFIYNYRLYDLYRQPIASLVLLADRSALWRPAGFGYAQFGSSMQHQFASAKLMDYAPQMPALLKHSNPFALVTAAHLMTQASKGNDAERSDFKITLTTLLYERRWPRQRVIDLLNVLGWMMMLPDALQQRYRSHVANLERGHKMRYISTFERDAVAKGLKEGLEKGLEKGREEGREESLRALLAEQLAARFGAVPAGVDQRLGHARAAQLHAWALALLRARTIDEVFEAA
ncbi:MAG: hypothetical protein V4463_15760 [Pseudomonadota bacterium]